jgi:hypothetical protein
MAFPGNHSFKYYRGDTYEFKIYPKLANGNDSFDLTGYEDARFTISTQRGPAGANSQIVAFAAFSDEDNSIRCAITPENGAEMSGSSYVYDVEIRKDGDDYNLVTTLLTGTITVEEQVTGASEDLES